MLYIVPTPIGNLGDITFRALETLKQVHRILCEDTRHTLKLLTHFEIQKPLVSFHEHTSAEKQAEILGWLEQGEDLALVSDAGMPVVSDPGYKFVREAIRKNLPVTVLPGPSALLTALVLSALPPDAFSFLGFPPNKGAARKRFFQELVDRTETLIFYESPFRIAQCLASMKEVFGDREAAVLREMSKKFEEAGRGRLSKLIAEYSRKSKIGEAVIVLAGKDAKPVFEAQTK